MGHLTVVMGCMFAQKTTELLRYIRRYRSIGHHVLVINSAKDVRYGTEGIISHDEKREEAVRSATLAEMDERVRSGDYQAVVIDEAQFFPDLFEYVIAWADECSLSIVVAGLDGTFEREPFGDLLRLVPHAEELIRLTALCGQCRDGTRAIYSQRIVEETGDVLVGGKESYVPVCRRHYLAVKSS
jgi:thymidine kinase